VSVDSSHSKTSVLLKSWAISHVPHSLFPEDLVVPTFFHLSVGREWSNTGRVYHDRVLCIGLKREQEHATALSPCHTRMVSYSF
jgi:hypothetical protein